jgi:hypothetical protein
MLLLSMVGAGFNKLLGLWKGRLIAMALLDRWLTLKAVFPLYTTAPFPLAPTFTFSASDKGSYRLSPNF